MRPIVHIEIPAQDREVAARFYGDLFGWTATHSSEPMPYTSMTTGIPQQGVGLPEIGEMCQPNDVIVYIGSDDITADLTRIEAAGGKRAGEPFKVGDFGEMVLFTDPSGNKLALWKDFMQQAD